MSEKRYCKFCCEILEELPTIHDPIRCEKIELIKGRATIIKLNANIRDWKDGWFAQRDATGKNYWDGYYDGQILILESIKSLTPDQYNLLTKLKVLIKRRPVQSKGDKLAVEIVISKEDRVRVLNSLPILDKP